MDIESKSTFPNQFAPGDYLASTDKTLSWRALTPLFLSLTMALFLALKAPAQSLSGSVKDLSGAAVAGALVTHVPTGGSTTSLTDGSWTLTPISVRPRAGDSGPVRWKGDMLSYSLRGPGQWVEIAVFGTEGRKIKVLVNGKKNAGSHVLDPARQNLPPGHYLLKVRIGKRETVFPMQVTARSEGSGSQIVVPGPSAAASKKAAQGGKPAPGDTLRASKAGYLPAVLVLTAGQTSGIPFILTPAPSGVEYKLPPPNACMNQFFAKGCVTGDANSAAEKSLVTKLASDVRGAKSVTNDMTVKS